MSQRTWTEFWKELDAIAQKAAPKDGPLADLYAEQRPGCCVVCDGPIPAGRKPKPGENQNPRPRRTCGDAECRRVYGNFLRDAARVRARKTTPRTPMPADAIPLPGELG